MEGLEKFTDALKVWPGWALESCECVHRMLKLRVWKNSDVPFSPVWSLE